MKEKPETDLNLIYEDYSIPKNHPKTSETSDPKHDSPSPHLAHKSAHRSKIDGSKLRQAKLAQATQPTRADLNLLPAILGRFTKLISVFRQLHKPNCHYSCIQKRCWAHRSHRCMFTHEQIVHQTYRADTFQWRTRLRGYFRTFRWEYFPNGHPQQSLTVRNNATKTASRTDKERCADLYKWKKSDLWCIEGVCASQKC